ncbi:MAG: YjjG family noncanonical pyrimidine nucleotidase [Flavobacteriales bacterium]|jgi:putative hydrolase of the HAD superfamily|uniref:YjjG family noncanonical pyrimidine nucleotidase n=1 Tax=Candidatus Ulvibacter alkanivorans TaxID=2267620 RepID=UPI000DF3A987|nr:YjjG family noncanonical pyrimidine nucleotidase [Candidatus Ulvibacter alkanivorans]MCH2490598.1 YjjG family noncanonical pyrimidine nucleotidase [Flavobacteriales bacterium]
MLKQSITDVFFDLDHTLWDFDRNSQLAFQRVFVKHQIQLELQDFIRAYEPINLRYWKLYREEKVTKEQLRRGRLTETFQQFSIAYPIETIDALAVAYIDELPIDNHLLEGSMEVLEYLKPKYKLHIITNGFKEVQHLKLANSKIAPFFETITTSEEVGVKKPNPLVFKTAMKKAKTSAESSIMIGDSLEADIEGAAAVGMNTLFYNYRKEQLIDDIYAIDQLIEIKNFL